MADWYVSSVAYAALPAWAATTAYTVGQIIKPLTAPGATAQYTYRCTTAGTSAATEPGSWTSALGNTTTSGAAVFTNVGGSSAYGWAAAVGALRSIDTNRVLVGDRVFLSSDHSEVSTTWNLGGSINAFGLIQVISVNRAGSVPPVASDIQNGAALNNSGGNAQFDAYCNMFWQGISVTASGSVILNPTGTHAHYFKNCAFVLGNSATKFGSPGAGAKVTLDNTTIQFGNTGSGIGTAGSNPFELLWINTPAAIPGATLPTQLFYTNGATATSITCRGVDLSAITGTLLKSTTNSEITKVLLDSCKIAAAVTRYALTSTTGDPAYDEIELVNCFDGTSIINERHTAAGDVTTDAATTLSTGARDNVGGYSHKLVSSARSDICTMPLDGFWLDVGNTGAGVAKTATVEIVSSAALNNNDIKLLLEYMGTSGSSLASFGESLSSVLTTPAALPSSAATWGVSGSVTIAWSLLDQAGITLSNASLTLTTTGGTGGIRGAYGYSSGKFYWEYTTTSWGINDNLGVGTSSALFSTASLVGNAITIKSGNIYVNSNTVQGTLGARANGDIIGVAVDLTARLIWFRVAPAGNWNGSGTANPATGIGGFSISALTGALFPFYVNGTGSGAVVTANFGASAFTGSVPSGFTSGLSVGSADISWYSKQQLQVSFTPQTAGRVKGLVRLGKPSTTVWVNPQVRVT